MTAINELKEQLGYIEIGLNDTFTFHCTQCGKCCIHQEDILLSPKALFNIAKNFRLHQKMPLNNIAKLILDLTPVSQ